MRHPELRQDPVSGDWILLSPGRARRLDVKGKKLPRKRQSKATCPFENPLTTHEPALIYEGRGGWEVVIVHNKYPAVFRRDRCGSEFRHGPYRRVEGVGYHNVVITRRHDKNFAHLSKEGANQVLQAFRDRYLTLETDPCLAYVSMFHNWGPSAGATVYHPHYQIIAIPVIPPDVQHSLRGSAAYFEKHRACVHCRMIAYERRERKRVVLENDGAIAVTPYVSREPFELRIFPKRHTPFFENTSDRELSDISELLRVILRRLERNLRDPDYNFFIHTAPVQHKERYRHYHWHIEVVPKLNIAAGFELGTGIEINIVDPDDAARVLRRR